MLSKARRMLSAVCASGVCVCQTRLLRTRHKPEMVQSDRRGTNGINDLLRLRKQLSEFDKYNHSGCCLSGSSNCLSAIRNKRDNPINGKTQSCIHFLLHWSPKKCTKSHRVDTPRPPPSHFFRASATVGIALSQLCDLKPIS